MAGIYRSLFNLAAAAQALFVDHTGIQSLMVGATLNIYDDIPPLTADTALSSANDLMATIPFPATILGVYGPVHIAVLDPLPDVVWLRSGTPTFARVTQGSTKVFDCSVGLAEGKPDLVIKQNPVRIGDTCHVDNGKPSSLGRTRKVIVTAD